MIFRIVSTFLSLYFLVVSFAVINSNTHEMSIFLAIGSIIFGCLFGYYGIWGKIPDFFKKPNSKYKSFTLNPEIQSLLDDSLENAVLRGHNILSAEHFLFSIMHNKSYVKILEACKLDIEKVTNSISLFLEQSFDKIEKVGRKNIKIDDELNSVLKRVIIRANASKQKSEELSQGDIIASILESKDTFASKVLVENNIRRINILEYLTCQYLQKYGFEVKKDIHKLNISGLCKVIIYNDNYTTMNFVVDVLESVFNATEEGATEIMLNIHKNGFGVAGEYEYNEAVNKIDKIHQLARAKEFPLMCSIEKIGEV